MWVSANPFQLGAFVAYDLDEVFDKMKSLKEPNSVAVDSLTIPEDEFMYSKEFKNYMEFKKQLILIHSKIENKESVSDEDLLNFIELNPEYWLSYFTVGEYYFHQKNYQKAVENYQIALTKE